MFFESLLVLLLAHFSHGKHSIDATGGGVVEQGTDLILSYNIDAANDKWFLCKWIRQTPVNGSDTDTTDEYCLFTDATLSSTGNVSKLSCNPGDFMEANQMEYIGTTKTECKIKVKNASQDDAVKWSTNIESDSASSDVNITVATPIDNITQLADPIQAGTEGFITCTVIGGEPVPNITYIYGNIAENTDLNVTNRIQSTVEIESGKFKTIVNNTIVPEIKDDGRQIDCIAIQYDNADPPKILFRGSQGTNGSLNASPLNLSVVYPPQPTDNQTFSYVRGAEAAISFTITANPGPTTFKWIVKNPNDTTNNSTDTQSPSTNDTMVVVDIELPAGEKRDRFTTYNVSTENAPQYVVNLTIANISDSDHSNMFYLMVTNSMGTETYYFDINITDFVTTTTTTTTEMPSTTTQSTTEGKGLSGGVTAIIVIIVLVVVVVGALIFYKKYYLHRQTVPHYNLR